MSDTVIPAREKFIRRQIERAWEIAGHYRALLEFAPAAFEKEEV